MYGLGALPQGALESSIQAFEPSEHERLPPLASTSASSVVSQQQQLDRAALLQIELQRQQELLRLQQSLGLLASSSTPTVLPDYVLQALVPGLDNNALLLLQLQQQQQPFLNPWGQFQSNMLAANVAAAQQQVQLEQQQQQQQQQFLTAPGFSLPTSSQLDSSSALGMVLGTNPQATTFSGLPHLPQARVEPSVASLDQHPPHRRASSRESVPNNKESSSPEPLKRPKRPLTSYNLFFKARREQLLAEQHQQQLHQQQIALKSDSNNQQVDQPKHPRRKNSIGFEDLAKIIGKEWKEIDPQTLAEFEAQAQRDKERYLKELEVYKAGRNAELEVKRAAMEQSVSDEVRQRYFAEVSGKKRKKR
jgi:hypothetical protein